MGRQNGEINHAPYPEIVSTGRSSILHAQARRSDRPVKELEGARERVGVCHGGRIGNIFRARL
jgi:hypothetical protein